jgi:hypothetical protein
MAITGQACTRVLVSWDGNGLFTGPHDDVTADVGGTPGVSIDLGRDGARQLSPPKVSAADFALRNDTGRYSQERADSPVYQRVLPGRPVRIETEHGTTDAYDTPTRYDETDYYDGAATFTLARTVVDDIAQETALGDQMVTLRTLGLETLLIGTTVTVGLMTAPRVDQCVTAILDAVGWPVDRRAVSVSDTTLLYWWCNDRAPWDALLELLASEGPGAIYIANALGEATFHFENRNYRSTAARSTTTQQTYFDRRGTGLSAYDEATAYDEEDAYDGEVDTLYFTALSYDPGFRNIFNEARYPTRRRTVAGTPSVIWSYGAPLQPSTAGTTLIIHPQDPFVGAVVPVVGTDYTVSGGTVSMSLSAPSGLVAFLTVTATSGVPTVAGPTASPTTGLQLRAQPLTVLAETTVTNDVDASDSIARFSPIPGQAIPRMLALAGWAEIDPAVARAVCDAWVLRYMLPRPSVTVELRNADGAHVSEILHRRVSDRIGLRERNTGLATDVWVNSVALTITGAGGRDIRARFGCEKCDDVAGFAWDDATTLWDSALWGV